MKRLVLIFAAALMFCSCEKKVIEEPMMNSFAEKKVMAMRASNDSAVFEMEEAVENYSSSSSEIQRKVVWTGYISVEVQSLEETKKVIDEWVKKYGGYVVSTNESKNNVHWTVNIPSEKFDAAMKESGSFGKLNNKNVYSRDVTEQYYDLETRLNTRRMLLDQLKKYLAQAKDMKDLLQIETKINEVTTEIERMQGQMNRLKNQISYSTIDVDAMLPVNRTETGFMFPDLKNSAGEFLGNVMEFFVHFFFVVLYIFIFGVPIILLGILIYWLSFGKVGLVKKLFNKTRK